MDAHFGATAIVKKLTCEGYTAYFAGGWVRDFLMGHPSSDIDIATNAPPAVILDLFPQTILVGLAFGVVIVVSEGHQFEVSTFRRDISYVNGRKPEKIELSTPEEDALRRDFTINGMFYNPLKDEIYDYVHGIEDLKKGIIRTIGDPSERFDEDRLRMIRAIRFAARFGFTIDPDTQEGIIENADTLFPAVAMERIWQEFNKMAKSPHFDQALIDMHHLGLLPVIFPTLKGIHLKEIKKNVENFHRFPKDTPTILFLAHLFPHAELKELGEICQYLRTSTQDAKLLEIFMQAKKLIGQEEARDPALTDFEWTHFYANKQADLCLEVLVTKQSDSCIFLEKHRERRNRLKPHIQRLIDRKPLINGKILKEQGIREGKVMGNLMEEAERIAILHNFHAPAEILPHLIQSPNWPKQG